MSKIAVQYHGNGNIHIIGEYDKFKKKQGVWSKYHWTGKLYSETLFLDDKEHGLEKFYDEDGDLVETRLWNNGELIDLIKND
jgi:antitoxin component YwqK of YwqJK toxin-antitoxin module